MATLSVWAAVGGLAAGVLLGGGATKLWYDGYVVPSAIAETARIEERKCLERVTAVSAAAKASERARQLEAGQAATSSFQQSIASAAEAAASIARQFEEDNHALTQWLDDTGRSCTLDADTLERVLDGGPADR